MAHDVTKRAHEFAVSTKMAAELAMSSVTQPAMPVAPMLLLSLGVSTFAGHVALDLARRVCVLRTRAGFVWLLGSACALSLGIWSCRSIGVSASCSAAPCAVRLPRAS